MDSLEKPRRVLIMVKAGKPVDAVIDQLVPLLEPGDIVIDAGNSHFEDTRREAALAEKDLHFVSAGPADDVGQLIQSEQRRFGRRPPLRSARSSMASAMATVKASGAAEPAPSLERM